MELDSSGGTGQGGTGLGGTGPGGTGFQPVKRYPWGLDLAGQNRHSAPSPFQGEGWGEGLLEAAGGIGGLLAMQDTNGTPTVETDDLKYVYLYDANGNVGQLVAWAQGYGGTTEYAWDTQQSPNVRLVAAYEYDLYGNTTAQSGAYAGNNPFRFSTKYYDTQTGLGYWGYRYYSPGLGRWISRDPIGERGGNNRYAYATNTPLSFTDPLGLSPKDYKYDIASKPCGFWVVCPVKLDRSGTKDEKERDAWRQAEIDEKEVPGFEVRFFPQRNSEIGEVEGITPCCCACPGVYPVVGNIRVIQVVKSHGYPAWLDPHKPGPKATDVSPDYPWGYVGGGGQVGSGTYSHQDAPVIMKWKGEEHEFEVCAVCRLVGRDTVLGCIAFRYFDGGRGNAGTKRELRGLEQHKFKFGGKDCFGKRSEKPAGLYQKGIEWWRENAAK